MYKHNTLELSWLVGRMTPMVDHVVKLFLINIVGLCTGGLLTGTDILVPMVVCYVRQLAGFHPSKDSTDMSDLSIPEW